LAPIAHRGEDAQADLAMIRSRDVLVRARTQLVNHVRGTVKAMGKRVKGCSTPSFHRQAASEIPDELLPALNPILAIIEQLSAQIAQYDRGLDGLCEKYPETQVFQEIPGVGPVLSLTFALTLEQPERFQSSRDVPAYVGLIPKSGQSGDYDPQLRITKAGNTHLRRLLVGSARYILGPFGPECDLRRWGLKLAGNGSKRARGRAAVGVARKLAVLLHRLWVTGECYDPNYQETQQKRKKGVAQ
jgi:transposase